MGNDMSFILDSSVIIGALIGAIISLIAFQYKERKGRIELINISLFHLLDVWKTLAIAGFMLSDSFMQKLVDRIKARFPQENISKEDETELKRSLISAIPAIILAGRADDMGSLASSYNESIKKLATIIPIMAYQLQGNVFLLAFLNALEKIPATPEEKEAMQQIMSQLHSLMYIETCSQLEDDLKYLAFKSGVLTWISTRRYIAETKERRVQLESVETVDSIIDQFVDPLTHQHYDKAVATDVSV